MKNPTENMLKAREYFEDNKDRVEKCTALLIDDLSKEVYNGMIDFRCKSDPKKFPAYDKTSAYFYNEFFTYGDDEVFIDCGAMMGDTITHFKTAMAQYGAGYSKIIAFEPDSYNYKNIKNAHPDVIAIQAGVWSENTTGYFHDDNSNITSSDSEKSGVAVTLKSIDNCPECEGVTLIKMDIEGSETNALIGAKRTIEKYKPKLAICIYHSDEEMISIIEWIHENFPEYSLYVRQHIKYLTIETVLYCVVK